jgi:hypothetical protein
MRATGSVVQIAEPAYWGILGALFGGRKVRDHLSDRR